MSDELQDDDSDAIDLSIIPVEARRVTTDQMETIGIELDAPHDDVATMLMKAESMLALAKAIKGRIDTEAAAWIEANGRVTITDGVFYDVGHPSTTKCVDVSATFDALLSEGGGDIAVLKACLSSGAFKHGACSKVLPSDVYAKCFITTSKAKLKPSDGAKQVAKQLIRRDYRFLK